MTISDNNTIRDMPRKSIPSWIKREIVKLWLHGSKRPEICEKVGYSEGAVWSVINEFKEKAKEQSLEEATRIYKVKEDLDTLREITSYIKSWMSVEDAIEGLKVSKELLNAGVEYKELKDFLNVYKMVSSNNFPSEAFIRSALDLYEISKESGLSPQEVTKHHEEVLGELREMEKRLEALKVKVSGLEEKRNQVVELERRISRAKRELTECNASISRLKSMKETLKKEISDAIAKGENAIGILNAKMSQSSEKSKALMEEVQRLEREVKVRSGMASEAERKFKEFDGKLEAYKALNPLLKLVVNCEGERHQVLPIALMFNERLCEWFKTHSPRNYLLESGLKSLINNLMEEIGLERQQRLP